MPILATIALWTAVGAWNDWTTAVHFLRPITPGSVHGWGPKPVRPELGAGHPVEG